jgi:uncharacterized protein YndB with AHSA1/START domain
MNPIQVSDDTIVQEITVRSSARRTFEALTIPEELVKWWGVEGKFQVIKMESDLRATGKWRMHVRGRDGRVSTVAGEYRKIEPPRLLVFTWIREQENTAETLVRWDLEETNGITRVRVTHSHLTSESLRRRNDGWPLILRLLQAHVEATQ